jgi:hypothetical protein
VVQNRVTVETRNPFVGAALSIFGVTRNQHFLNHVTSTLIAGLERARDGALLLEQKADWMPIRVSRRADDDPTVDASVPPA